MVKIKPTEKQLKFLDWEFGVFIHFGIRTFYEGHRDWDMKPMPLEGFNPTELDCENWVLTAKEAGAKYAVFVCKHHDGFANWPSLYTEYSVKNTPWKNGKGDVVREFVDACRKHGICSGLYYSPAQFGSKDVISTDYDNYFINQISELLTNYGKIDYLWFDGCGSEDHKYDTDRIVKEIRRLQPDILIFNMWDPDTRWVGNEAGFAHVPNYNEVNSSFFSVQTEKTDSLGEKMFLPAECDMRMRLENWFYSDADEDTVKSVEELMGVYCHSVGRGANMLINIGPDRRGLFPDKDAKRLIEFGNEVKNRYGKPFMTMCDVQVENDNEIVINVENALLRAVILEEDLAEGEHIDSFEINGVPYSYGESRAVQMYVGKTVGHKRICNFEPMRIKKLKIKTVSDAKTVLKKISLF